MHVKSHMQKNNKIPRNEVASENLSQMVKDHDGNNLSLSLPYTGWPKSVQGDNVVLSCIVM